MSEESSGIRQSGDVKIVDVNNYLGSYAVAELRETLAGLVNQDVQKNYCEFESG